MRKEVAEWKSTRRSHHRNEVKRSKHGMKRYTIMNCWGTSYTYLLLQNALIKQRKLIAIAANIYIKVPSVRSGVRLNVFIAVVKELICKTFRLQYFCIFPNISQRDEQQWIH